MMKIYKDYSNVVLLFCSSILLILGVISYLLCLKYCSTNFDHSFYIGSARLILEGKYPFVDFNPGYPPLEYWLMTIPLSLFPDNVYTHLIVIYLVTFFNTFMVYLLSMKISCHRLLSMFCAVYFLVLTLCFDGMFFLLEPFVLLFGLPSLLFVQRNTPKCLFAAGFLAFCAAWTKQYGIGFIVLNVLYISMSQVTLKERVRSITWLLIGFSVSVILQLGIIILCGGDLSDIQRLSGGSYAKWGIDSLKDGYKKILWRIPTLMPCILFLIYGIKKQLLNPWSWVCLAGIFGFMLQCYVRNYDHYITLALPFAVLVIPIVWTEVNSKLLKGCLLLILLISSLMKSLTIIRTDINMVKGNGRNIDIYYANEVADVVPVGSDNVFLSMWALPTSTYNKYTPSLLKEHGMTNGFTTNSETIKEYLQTSTYCIIDTRDLSNKRLFSDENLSIIENRFYIIKQIPLNNGENAYVYKVKKTI